MDVQVASTYEEPRAHAVRERYLDLYGGEGLPVPVEAIAEDLLGLGVPGLSLADMRSYLEHVADRRLAQLDLPPLYGSRNPFAWLFF